MRYSLLGAILLLGCGSRDSVPIDRAVRLAIAERSNANPSIAAHGDIVAVTWSASTPSATDVYSSISVDGGRNFSTPVQVNGVPGDARINSEFPPRIALTGRPGEVVVVWTTRRADTSMIVSSRSIDTGRTWSAAAPIPGGKAKGNRGWQSIAVDSAGQVLALWLDHRDVTPSAAAHHHASTAGTGVREDPTARAMQSRLYFTSIADSAARPIASGVCYCCKTALVTRGSRVYAAWRHVYPGSVRDMAFTMSTDGGKTFATPLRVSQDEWKIDGCPENGPALAVDTSGNVRIAWVAPPDGKSDTPLALFYSLSRDGRSFEKRVRIPTGGQAAHPQIVVDRSGRVVIGWDELVGGDRRVAFAAQNDTGAIEPFYRDSLSSGWPVIASLTTGIILGWAEGKGPGSTVILRRRVP